MSALAPAVGWLLDPTDPFSLRAGVSWIALAPLLLALQHGLSPGLASAALIGAGAFWSNRLTGGQAATAAGQLTVVGLGLAAVAGLFRDHWDRQRQQLGSRAERAERELLHLSRTHLALQHSHGDLEAQVAADHGPSLAQALDRAEARMARRADGAERGAIVLSLLAARADVLAASLWRVRASELASTPFACSGDLPASATAHAAAHPLVQRALLTGNASFVDTLDGARDGGAVLAVLPLQRERDVVSGLLVVHGMPQSAFHVRGLRRVQAICDRLSCELVPAGEALRASRPRTTRAGAWLGQPALPPPPQGSPGFALRPPDLLTLPVPAPAGAGGPSAHDGSAARHVPLGAFTLDT